MTKTFRRVQAWYRSRRHSALRQRQELRTERSRLIGFVRFYSERIRDLVEAVWTRVRRAGQGRPARVTLFAILMLSGLVIWQTGATPGVNNMLLFARSGSARAPEGPETGGMDLESLPLPVAPSGLAERGQQWLAERFELVQSPESRLPDAESSRSADLLETAREAAPSEPVLPATVDLSDIIWPAVGDVARGYGWMRDAVSGDWRFHPDILIAPSSESATVRPSLPGVVEEIAASAGGYAVLVRHTESWTSEYRGLAKVTVAPGEWVSPESVLGSVSRGGEGGLRFGLRRGGEPVDPADYLYMPVIAE